MKACKTCGIVKALEDFQKAGTTSGRGAHCKDCHNIAQRAKYATPEGKAQKKVYMTTTQANARARGDGTIAERFWAKVDKGDGTGCWNWTGSKRHMGHGGIWFRGENWMAHRVSLILHGFDLPADMHVDHKCRNTSCVRPDHLRIVTPEVNGRENNNSPLAKNAAAVACPYGHAYSGPNLHVVTPKTQKTRHGRLRAKPMEQRNCNVCYLARRDHPEQSYRWHPSLAEAVAKMRELLSTSASRE